MDTSEVERRHKWQSLSLYVAAIFIVAEFVASHPQWLPIWEWLATGAAACYLFFVVRYLVALYKARASRRRRPYPY